MWIPSYIEMYPHLQKSGQNECGQELMTTT